MNVVVKGIGHNLASMQNALSRLGVDAVFSDEPAVIKRASRVILPGVGTASCAMENLHQRGLVDVIRELTVPVLGICVGMQILMTTSDEDGVNTLDIIPGKIRRLLSSEDITIPHMGWNRLQNVDQKSPLLQGLYDGSFVYFVHSYAVSGSEYELAQCEHGKKFGAVIGKDNFYGVQFHPERSAKMGEQLLKNFFSL